MGNDGKELYKPLVEDYSIPSAPALQNLKNIEPAWYDRQSNLHNLLVYMQCDTTVSPQVTDTLSSLQTLKKNTKDKVNKRILTTQLFNRWYDEMNSIPNNQDPDDCQARTKILEEEIERFSNVFEECVEMTGIEDIHTDLVKVKERVEELKREIIQKYAEKYKKEAEYKDFQRETRQAIDNEQRDRKSDIKRLEREIEELCESRDDIEYKIKSHDGDIARLNSLMDELSRVNSSLRAKCSSLQKELDIINTERALKKERQYYDHLDDQANSLSCKILHPSIASFSKAELPKQLSKIRSLEKKFMDLHK